VGGDLKTVAKGSSQKTIWKMGNAGMISLKEKGENLEVKKGDETQGGGRYSFYWTGGKRITIAGMVLILLSRSIIVIKYD